jgi:enterochelin esterase family protein
MARRASEPMRNQTNRIWSLTVGPLPPDLYLYGFEVDGLRVPDPSNRFARNGYPGLSSVLEVPGARFLSIRDVPHGTVHVHNYLSRVTNSARRLHVYTPPGYDSTDGRTYPVLFLLHGSWDNDAAWAEVESSWITCPDRHQKARRRSPSLEPTISIAQEFLAPKFRMSA